MRIAEIKYTLRRSNQHPIASRWLKGFEHEELEVLACCDDDGSPATLGVAEDLRRQVHELLMMEPDPRDRLTEVGTIQPAACNEQMPTEPYIRAIAYIGQSTSGKQLNIAMEKLATKRPWTTHDERKACFDKVREVAQRLVDDGKFQQPLADKIIEAATTLESQD